MESGLAIAYVMRWVHIASAMLVIGGPFFVRFVLTPAAGKALDAEQHDKLHDAINNRWRHIVYLLITLFIISGTYTFMVPTRVNGVLITARWKDFGPEDKKMYHMLFGIKVLAAFGIFFLASALAGRTKTFAPIRAKRKTYLTVLLVLAAVVLTCASMMKYLPTHAGTFHS